MKRTIKLLIILLVVVVGLSSYINSSLAKEYSKIDQNDKFYEYEKHSDLNMDAIKIIGGNKSIVKVEKGDANTIFIHKRIVDRVVFSNDSGILAIEFDKNYTDSIQSPNNIRVNNSSPRVIITYTDVNQIWANNARLTVDYAMQKEVDIYCKGSTVLMMNMLSSKGQLKLNASGKSHIGIAQSEPENSIDYAAITLSDESVLKLDQFRTDSLNLSMGDLCRIDCDNHLFKQLSQSE